MVEDKDNVTMAESIKMVKISQKNFERIQKYGFAGESINTALTRALDVADKDKVR